MGVREEADAGEEERQRPGRVEAYQKEKEQETEREKRLKRMPGSGRARPGPAAAEWCGTEGVDAG